MVKLSSRKAENSLLPAKGMQVLQKPPMSVDISCRSGWRCARDAADQRRFREFGSADAGAGEDLDGAGKRLGRHLRSKGSFTCSDLFLPLHSCSYCKAGKVSCLWPKCPGQRRRTHHLGQPPQHFCPGAMFNVYCCVLIVPAVTGAGRQSRWPSTAKLQPMCTRAAGCALPHARLRKKHEIERLRLSGGCCPQWAQEAPSALEPHKTKCSNKHLFALSREPKPAI